MAKKLWGGRFGKPTHTGFDNFSSSLRFDHELFTYDVQATVAHVEMLSRQGLIRTAERKKIVSVLNGMKTAQAKYAEVFQSSEYEDIHSFIEAELVRKCGNSAKKIHTGRSRNDQVNQAVRMYCKDQIVQILKLVRKSQKTLVSKAKQYTETVIPGMTHLQKAQPVLFAHVLLSYCSMLGRSFDALAEVYKRVDVLTLGSGALAGSSIPLDREYVRKKLGFGAVSDNSLDAVGSRDFIAEFIFQLSLLATHISRIAEDLMIYQLEEINLIQMPEEFCTGSSMMPQKRNGDFAELSRGAASIPIGNTVSLLTLMKGLPTSYNRDLQWDKPPLFESVRTVKAVIGLCPDFFRGIKVNKRAAKKLMENDQLCATDLAEWLVVKGVPFRDAHENVGKFVKACEIQGIKLADADDRVCRQILGFSKKMISTLLVPENTVNFKKTEGSTSSKEVKKNIKKWEGRINAAFRI